MWKTILSKILKFFFGIDLQRIISDKHLLESSSNELKQRNEEIKGMLHDSENLLSVEVNNHNDLKNKHSELQTAFNQLLSSNHSLIKEVKRMELLVQKLTEENLDKLKRIRDDI